MADDFEVLPPEHEDEEGGGPVKSFLEHLEDLRWTFVKCAIAVALGILVSLSGSPYIVKFLEWPLVLAQRVRVTDQPRVVITMGTNVLSRMLAKDFPVLGTSTNQDLYLKVAPIPVGTNMVLGMVPDPNPPEVAKYGIQVGLKTLGPTEPFVVAVKIALYGGAAIAAPFVLFFLGQFILPALHVHEKRLVYRIAGFGTLLFFMGVAFCYFIVTVVALSSTVTFSNWLGFGADEWRASEYISFVCWFMIGMGVAFELPLVLLTLVKIGILDAERLAGLRMYWVVVGLVVSAFITPDGNPMTMLLMFIPLHILYEISVLIAKWWDRADRKAASETAE
ncbi:MAG: preprotein translocase subunit TatC [Verrucomicrobia bacterium]|nr:preprotein translocase subunit TatC [Verrucomicrobiota bacterium]